MRPFKQSVGLPVTHPNASYEELLAKLSKTSSASQDESSSVFAKLFAKPPRLTKQEAAKAQPKDSDSTRRLGEGQGFRRETISVGADLPEVDLSQFDHKLDVLIDNIVDYSLEQADARVSALVEGAPSSAAEQFEGEPPEEPSRGPASMEPVSASQESLLVGELEAPAPQEDMVVAEEPLPEDVDPLFSRVAVDIDRANAPIEFSAAQFIQPGEREGIEVLFDLAREAIANPESEKQYVTEIEVSDKRHVEAEPIVQEQLKQAERVIETPLITLKGLRPREEHAGTVYGRDSKDEPLAPASAWRRLAACAVDVVLVLLTGSLAGAFSFIMVNGGVGQIFAILARFQLIDGLILLQVVIVWILCLSVLYPLVAYIFWETTFGEFSVGVKPVSKGEAFLARPNAIVRALTLPVSVLFFGFVPAFSGGVTVHDLCARTEIGLVPKGARIKDAQELS